MAGDMTEEQIKELRAQYDREYENLEKAIRDEKGKQLTNMRGAMLNRRINQEKSRREKEEAEEAEAERARIANMQADEAKAFRAQLKDTKITTEEDGLAAVQAVDSDDKLKARLAKWQRQIDEEKLRKSALERDIVEAEAYKQAELDETAKMREEREKEKLAKQQQVAFTIQELYRRILKVEKLATVVNEGEFEAAAGEGLDRMLTGMGLNAARRNSSAHRTFQ